MVEPVEPKPLFRWPNAGRVDRIIPKERLYSESGVTTAVRQRFIDQVQRVRWAYKLGEESVRLKGTANVSEIQVFEVDLKASELDDSVLASIDKSIPSPIVFELRRDDGSWVEQAMSAADQQASAGKPKAKAYFRSGWVRATDERAALPQALDIEGLYAQLLGALLPHSLRRGERLSDGIARMDHIRKLEREIGRLEKKVRLEPQFNRKVDLRRDLRTLQAELDTTTAPDETTTEDATWRS
ncbi:DUF4391 domain-containing protein [Serinicoccus sp. CNJ-927]|uniref:DUF4391 domain-containing protein n=1 Tax=Serinicoccus sp. CNJ-927 TaxID=1904970 RepID=UPI001300DC70|nr:DUF4391 domain-containing protein [Serinicoccus sp. CNJ-927]